MGIIAWLVIGLIAGALARLIVPGRDNFGIIGTIILGVVGAVVGGWIEHALWADGRDTVGIIGATLGAILVLVVYRAAVGRGSRNTL